MLQYNCECFLIFITPKCFLESHQSSTFLLEMLDSLLTCFYFKHIETQGEAFFY